MTISYSGNFARLLLRWKGSVWKTAWKELISFLAVYYLIRILYRHVLPPEHRTEFEKIINEFDGFTKRIPLNFLLGFYVAAVVKRWWVQFELIAWPDELLNLLNVVMPPSEDDQLINDKRRTIARHINLTFILAWREVSVKVRKRFPSVEHLVKASLMTGEESELYEQCDATLRWYIPMIWSQTLVVDHCRQNNVSQPLLALYLNILHRLRHICHKLHCYDWVCLPLVYTQVAALCTYGYFALCLIGRQFLDPNSKITGSTFSNVDYYVPIFSVLEFLFYVGWFKVGQDLMRPLEEDDDDFEINYIVDRNIRVSLAIINETARPDKMPSVVPVDFWCQKGEYGHLPHTLVSAKLANHPPKLHAYVSLKNPGKYRLDETETLNNPPTTVSVDGKKVKDDMKKRRYF